MTELKKQRDIIAQQKASAQAVKEGGFEGLEVLISKLNEKASKLNRELVHSEDPVRDATLKGEIRAIETMIKEYLAFIKMDA